MKRKMFLPLLIVFLIISLNGCDNQTLIKEESSVVGTNTQTQTKEESSVMGTNTQTQTKEELSESEKKLKKEEELRGKCEKQCKMFFRKYIDSSKIKLHKNHYNKKLTTCFILTSDIKNTEKYLFDVNENKNYGTFIQRNNNVVFCFVLKKKCNSEKEWDSLVKPYMEE
jgi:hypothetical protein